MGGDGAGVARRPGGSNATEASSTLRSGGPSSAATPGKKTLTEALPAAQQSGQFGASTSSSQPSSRCDSIEQLGLGYNKAGIRAFKERVFWGIASDCVEDLSRQFLDRLAQERVPSEGLETWVEQALAARQRLEATTATLQNVEAQFDVNVVPRDRWGAEEPDTSKDPKWAEYDECPLPLRRIVVHHTADPQSQGPRDVQQGQMKRGYTDIAYHFLIDANGTIYEGRRIEAVGAHAGEIKGNTDIKKDPDYGSIGIVLTGDFEARYQNLWTPNQPTKQQVSSLQKLLNNLTQQYHIDPQNIISHRDIEPGHTDCPGENMVDIIKADHSSTRQAHSALQKARIEQQAARDEVERLKGRPRRQ